MPKIQQQQQNAIYFTGYQMVIKGWLRLDVNTNSTVQPSGLEIKRSLARPKDLGSNAASEIMHSHCCGVLQ